MEENGKNMEALEVGEDQGNHISTHCCYLIYNYSSTIYFQIEIVHMCFSNMCFCFTLSMCIQSQLLHAAFIVEQYFTRVTLMSLSFECASLLLFSTTSHNTFWLEAICVKLRFSKVALSHFSAAAPTLGSELHRSPLKAFLNWTWLNSSDLFTFSPILPFVCNGEKCLALLELK